jgi:hypothetical protein
MEVVELDEESRKLLSKMVRPKVKQSSAVNSEVIEEQINRITRQPLKETVTLTYIKPTSNTTVAKNVVRLQAEHSLFPCDVGTEMRVLGKKEDVISGECVIIGECTILKNVVIKKGNVTKKVNDGINIKFLLIEDENQKEVIYILLNSKLKEIL